MRGDTYSIRAPTRAWIPHSQLSSRTDLLTSETQYLVNVDANDVHRSSSNTMAVPRGWPPHTRTRPSQSLNPVEVRATPPVQGLAPLSHPKCGVDEPGVDDDDEEEDDGEAPPEPVVEGDEEATAGTGTEEEAGGCCLFFFLKVDAMVGIAFFCLCFSRRRGWRRRSSDGDKQGK